MRRRSAFVEDAQLFRTTGITPVMTVGRRYDAAGTGAVATIADGGFASDGGATVASVSATALVPTAGPFFAIRAFHPSRGIDDVAIDRVR